VVEGVKTGHVVIEEGRDRANGSEFLSFDFKPQTTAIEQAVKLLGFISALQDEERKTLTQNFRNLAGSQNMPAEELIARFGEFLGRPNIPAQGSSIWKRLVERLSSWFKT